MKISRSDRASEIVMHAVLIAFSIAALVPFILTIMVSISSEKSVTMNGFRFLPSEFSLEAYKVIFKDITVIRAYGVTLLVTSCGTLLSVFICALAGYAMSVKKVKFRNTAAMYFYIPMIFSAGLVPWYLIITRVLDMKNTLLALIIPSLVSPFNIFLMRNYFNSLPPDLAEAAEIDGAGPFKTFLRIILPISQPIIATVSLFVSLYYWNDWMLALWFIDSKELYPLQFMLYRIQSLIVFLQSNGGQFSNTSNLPMQTVQFATLVVTIGPIILVYPFIQKYFIKGIMIGAVKG